MLGPRAIAPGADSYGGRSVRPNLASQQVSAVTGGGQQGVAAQSVSTDIDMVTAERQSSHAMASGSSRARNDASGSTWGAQHMRVPRMQQQRMVRATAAAGLRGHAHNSSRRTGPMDDLLLSKEVAAQQLSSGEFTAGPAASSCGAPRTAAKRQGRRARSDVTAGVIRSPSLDMWPQSRQSARSQQVRQPQVEHTPAPPQLSTAVSCSKADRGNHDNISDHGEVPPASHPSDRVRPSAADMLLSQYLKSCQSWRELREAVARAGPEALNHIHMTAVASGLAKMAPGPQASNAEHAAFACFATSLLSGVQPHLAACGPRELSTLLWAAAKIAGLGVSSERASARLVVSSQWVSAVLARAQQELTRFNPQDTSMLMWAVAELSTLQPARGPLQTDPQPAGQPGTAKKAHSSVSGPHDTVINLPAGFLDGVFQATQGSLHRAGPQALSNTLWALAKLRAPPPKWWLAAFMQHSMTQLRDAAPQALANIGWALAVLGMSDKPPAAWRAAYLEATAAAAAYAPAVSLAQCAWAVARLRLRPGADWVEAVQDASAARLSSFVPQDLSNMVWALASVGARPSAVWMDGLLRGVRSQLRAFNAGELASVMWALAKLGYHPGEATLRPLLSAFAERMPSAGTQALSSVLWSCARLRVVPDPLWMEEWLSTLSAELGDVGPQELACCWWSLGVLRVRPPAWLAADMVAELKLQHDAMQARELVMVLVGYARLGAAPQRDGLDSLMSRLVSHVRDMVHGAPVHVPRTVAATISALAYISRTSTCGRAVGQGPAIRALLMYAARAHARCVEHAHAGGSAHGVWKGGDIAVVLHGLARLRQVPPPEWTRAALQAVAAQSGSGALMGVRDLACASWGIAQLCSMSGLGKPASARRKPAARGKTGGKVARITLPRHQGCLKLTPGMQQAQQMQRHWGRAERRAWVEVLRPHLLGQQQGAWSALRPGEQPMLLWALSRLEPRASRVEPTLLPATGLVLSAILEHVTAGSVLQPRDLSVILSALAATGMRPSDEFLQALMGPSCSAALPAGAEAGGWGKGPAPGVQLESFETRELCHVLWALARLRARMSGRWLLAACARLQTGLRVYASVPADVPAAGTSSQGSSTDGSERTMQGVRRITAHVPGRELTPHDCEMAARGLRRLAALEGISLTPYAPLPHAHLSQQAVSAGRPAPHRSHEAVEAAGNADTEAAVLAAWVGQVVQATLSELSAVHAKLLLRGRDARAAALARKLTYAIW